MDQPSNEPESNEPENERSLVANRYNRQELIEGWDQGKIRNACVAVIGSGPLANFTSASLVSLGFGNVEIYDNAHSNTNRSNDGEFLLNLTGKTRKNRKTGKRDFKVEALEEILSQINPLVRVKGVQTRIDSPPLAQLLGTPSVIIDVTNDSQSQATVLGYGQLKKVPVVVAVADSVRGEFWVRLPNKRYKTPLKLERYQSQHQGAIPSEVLGGIITEEVRKIIMPFNRKEKPVSTLSYSIADPQRFIDNSVGHMTNCTKLSNRTILDSRHISRRIAHNGEDELNIKETSLKDKHVLIVGAGALGNFAGIGLALAGVGEIDLLDFDTVETTNLNRQILFYDAVGDEKSKALAKKLKAINPRLRIRGLTGKLDENYANQFRSKENRPDLILDCVDNFGTRAIVNYFAVRYGIPLVSGGTSPSSGQVVAYQPGESACLDCKLSIDKALGKERTSHSCIYAAQPSVIMTNEVVGGLMAAEARSILAAENYGPHIRKMLRYDSTSPARAGLVGGDNPCACERGSIKEWLRAVIKDTK